MGITNFYTFLKNKGWEETIKIEDRIRDFKKKHPDKKPIIVFDFIQTIALLVGVTKNKKINNYCGGREEQITNLAEDWFKKLVNFDCKLVFWCKTRIEDDIYPLYKKNSIRKCRDISKIFANNEIRDLNRLKQIVRIVPNYIDGLIEIAKIYGDVHFSLQNKCDKDIAYYATKNNALAVVSADTDMVFYEGSWEIWNSYQINSIFDSTLINKSNIIKYFKLNDLQMTLFAALHETLTGGVRILNQSGEFRQFHLIASFLSENIKETKSCNILDDAVLNSLISYSDNNNLVVLNQINRDELIKQINIFNIEKINVVNFNGLPWLKDHTNECGTALYEILNELEITIRLLFAQGVRGLPNLLKNIKLRHVGLVRYSEWKKNNKNFWTTFHIFSNGYKQLKEKPIYPLAPVPTISTILGYEKQQLSIDQKLQLAIWVIFEESASNQWSIDFVKVLKNIINTTFFVPKLVLTLLLKNKIISKNEANILAISLKISEKKKHQEFTVCPKMLHRRCIQLGYIYIYTICSVSTSIKLSGLSKYLTAGYYFGFIFHNIYNAYFNNSKHLKELGDFSDVIF